MPEIFIEVNTCPLNMGAEEELAYEMSLCMADNQVMVKKIYSVDTFSITNPSGIELMCRLIRKEDRVHIRAKRILDLSDVIQERNGVAVIKVKLL